MEEIQSQSYKTSHKVRNFFIPSTGGMVLYLLASISLVLAYNYNRIIRWLSSSYAGSTEPLRLNILNSGISNSFTTVWDGRLGQILLWALIGAVSYIAIWFLKNLINSFENDVIIDHYLHPSGFSRAGYWGSAISGQVFFAAMCILWIIYTLLALAVVLPANADLAASALIRFNWSNSILYLLLCTLISALLIYGWVLISRIVRHLWQLFTL